MNEQTTSDCSQPVDGALPPAELSLLEGDVLGQLIRAELRKDGTTAALAIEVEVWDRVVHLRGVVAGPDDKTAAERVATRAAGGALVANDLQLQRGCPTESVAD